MRIFVTGATGVIGRRVVPLLLSRGHSVTAMAHRPAPVLRNTGVALVAADLFDAAALANAVAGHDAIVNLATHMPSPVWRMPFRSAWRLNDRIRREGSASLVDAALRGGVHTLVSFA